VIRTQHEAESGQTRQDKRSDIETDEIFALFFGTAEQLTNNFYKGGSIQ